MAALLLVSNQNQEIVLNLIPQVHNLQNYVKITTALKISMVRLVEANLIVLELWVS